MHSILFINQNDVYLKLFSTSRNQKYEVLMMQLQYFLCSAINLGWQNPYEYQENIA